MSFMVQNTRRVRPDACERQSILECEEEIVSTDNNTLFYTSFYQFTQLPCHV